MLSFDNLANKLKRTKSFHTIKFYIFSVENERNVHKMRVSCSLDAKKFVTDQQNEFIVQNKEQQSPVRVSAGKKL